jgi:hypothetical protein
MSDKKRSTKQEPPPTIIKLTLPTPSECGNPLERATATLLIQRGELSGCVLTGHGCMGLTVLR